MKRERRILVHGDWQGLGGPRVLGALTATPGRGKETFRFEYERAWLADPACRAFDPELALFDGPQFPMESRANFGVFLDSSPDRWGRLLMRRRAEREARRTGKPAAALVESDYLLGVHDQHRIGALRFRLEAAGAFLDDRTELAAPPMARLRELENASLQLEQDGAESRRGYDEWLRMLIAPGGSLGGARPKASVIDERGALWIAKFPSRHDDVDLGGWELVVHALARRAGVAVPEAAARRFNTRHHAFLSRRFDRDGGERLHFASAMTLLAKSDGEPASYLDLAQLITRAGARPAGDLEQLWRRVVFNIAVSNADDHLRNHGFLLVPGEGWALAPAYDVNAVAGARELVLNVTAADNAMELALAHEVAPFFRVKPARAREIVTEVHDATREWRAVAKAQGLAAREIERMAPAFTSPGSAPGRPAGARGRRARGR